jgi:hypothetical protein
VECGYYTTVPAFDAIRGQRSAYKDMAYDQPYGQSRNHEQTYTFFCDRASDGRALHFTLVVHYHTGVVLEIQEDTILSPP